MPPSFVASGESRVQPCTDPLYEKIIPAPAPLISGLDAVQFVSNLTSSQGLIAIDDSHETFDFNFNSHGPSFDFNFEFQALAASSSAGFATPFDTLDDFFIVSETASEVENFSDTWGPIDLNQLVAVDTSRFDADGSGT
jgi:hypothetical protein